MTALKNLTPSQRDEVRTQVRQLLEKTDSFQQLAPDARQKLARDLVTVVGFMADPKAAGGPPQAGALLSNPPPTEQLKGRLAQKQDIVQKDFSAPAAKAGGEAMADMMNAVKFPEFVSGLIHGVFESIVSSSIRQMNAYAKLLEQVVKSVDQFANDNVSQNQARDYLVGKYPDALRLDSESGSPRLALKDGDSDKMPDFAKEFGLPEEVDLSDEEGEQKLLDSARLQMAKLRQQQLSTMVLLGINRIVVTDGLINAKVVIDVKTKDTATRTATASSFDRRNENFSSSGSSFWGSDSWESSSSHDTMVSSALEDKSTSEVTTKANLTGEVRVNFKSETFPLDKMASGGEISAVQDRAKR